MTTSPQDYLNFISALAISTEDCPICVPSDELSRLWELHLLNTEQWRSREGNFGVLVCTTPHTTKWTGLLCIRC